MTKLYLDHLSEYDIVSVDVESTGLAWARGDSAFGVAIAAWDGEAMASQYFDIRDKPQILRALDDQLPKCPLIVNHQMKFDAHMLRKAGVRVPLDRIHCTSVRAALINEHEPHFNLDALCRKYIGRGKAVEAYDELAALFGGKATREVQMKNLHRAPAALAAKYATPDPELAILLYLWQEKEIEKQELQRVVALERDVLAMLVEVEEDGVRVDEARAARELVGIDGAVKKAQAQINKIAGKEVNCNSPVQMRTFFGVTGSGKEWKTDRGTLLPLTDAGAPSIDKDVLEVLSGLGDERAKLSLQIRKLTKARQFLKDHIIGHAVKGRVYPNYNQTRSESGLGTGTGRFSIDDPALQQIPARDKDIAAIVRSCFLPEEKQDWLCADWEQKEFRWFAHYTNDPTIIEAYARDAKTDYHAIVSKITGIPRNATHAGAANAKQINLGLVFGMGEGEMAYQMGLDYSVRQDSAGRTWKTAGAKAKAIFQTYHGAIPGVRQLLDRASSIARARGFVKTVMDRHIRFPGGKATHKAAGLVFQGTSADCMKVKMLALHGASKAYGYKYKLSVHDENNLSVEKGDDRTIQYVREELQTFDGKKCPIECRVPILASIKTGPTWWDACKKD